MRILDGHCHVASTDFVPRAFLGDVVGNVRARLGAHGRAPAATRLLDAYTAQHADHDADGLVRELDAAGVAKAVLLVPDFGLRLDCPLEPRAMAERHHAIRLRHPGRFWVYLGVDPRRGAAGLADFERSVAEFGIDGVKLYPPCGYSPSDRDLYPYYEICAARTMPVFVHTGPTAAGLDFEPAHPMLVDQAARDFPGVTFVLGHGGVTHVEVSSELAVHRRNVYLDLGGFAGAGTPDGWPAHLNRLFHTGLNHKIIFGTDWPLNRMSGGLVPLVEEITTGDRVFANVPRRDRELILGGNLLRVLPAEGSRP
ncbi:MAG TPA: amidohydrolase family protein [Actinophytocola sp.]|nr:amidohydrolase family protein [Actinophytocola sp.]